MWMPNDQQRADVRNKIIGYSNASLGSVKEAIAEELGYPAGSEDMDCFLASRFSLECCSCCGHWYDAADCQNDDGAGMYECHACHAEQQAR